MPGKYTEEQLDAFDVIDALSLSPLEASLMHLVRVNTQSDGVATIPFDQFVPLFSANTLQDLDNAFSRLEEKGLLSRFPEDSVVRPTVVWGDAAIARRNDGNNWLKRMIFRCKLLGIRF